MYTSQFVITVCYYLEPKEGFYGFFYVYQASFPARYATMEQFFCRALGSTYKCHL